MQKWICLIVATIVACTSTTLHALDLSSLTGTMEVKFQPMQSAGIKEGCTLVYHVVSQDYAYRKGNLIALAGNIAYMRNRERSNIVLSFKIGMIDSSDPNAKPEPPFFAYLQTPHGTTTGSKTIQYDSDMPGFRLFVYQLDGDILKVLEDILSGAPVTIGFNRKKGGLDVLVPLDLQVVESTIAADGSIKRRRSGEMLEQFAVCNQEVTDQILKHLKGK